MMTSEDKKRSIPQMTVGTRMRIARMNVGMDVSEVAKVMGVSHATVSAWELGKNQPPLDKIERYADVTSTYPAWLAFGCTCDAANPSREPEI